MFICGCGVCTVQLFILFKTPLRGKFSGHTLKRNAKIDGMRIGFLYGFG